MSIGYQRTQSPSYWYFDFHTEQGTFLGSVLKVLQEFAIILDAFDIFTVE